MTTELWDRIEKEKSRDRTVRRVSVGAWIATGVMLIIFALIVTMDALKALEFVALGTAPMGTVVDALMPLIAVFGIVSLLVAVLSTVGVFFRLRTASLAEIQLRLAALEGMLDGAND